MQSNLARRFVLLGELDNLNLVLEEAWRVLSGTRLDEGPLPTSGFDAVGETGGCETRFDLVDERFEEAKGMDGLSEDADSDVLRNIKPRMILLNCG